MKQIVFDYHYGIEAEQYAFYRIPKILMRDPLFKMLSLEAKVLYGMMMDRLVLSAKNGWKDERGRIYIYFTIEDICEAFMCGKDKAVKVLKELEKGDSLIERKKQGQGKTYEDFCKEFYKSVGRRENSNLQREELLPSEKAFAYRLKLDAMKRQGMRTDLTSTPVVQKLSVEIVAEEFGISREQVRRYICLTELIPDLLELVNEKKIAFRPEVELSYLMKKEQEILYKVIDTDEIFPSIK